MKMYLWNIGLIQVPDDIDRIFSSDGKYLVSPTLGDNYYFEMSGESMYYALKDVEVARKVELLDHKKRILDAVINRIHASDGKLFHNSLSGLSYDTQLRSSSAAVRILIEAINDGFNDFSILSHLVNYHYQFFFNWSNGIWFCHDTSEYNGRCPKSHLKTTVFKTNKNNTLTLNTHFDSLSTLLLLEPYANRLDLSFSIQEYINLALTSMQSIIDVGAYTSIISKILQRIDCKLLNINIAQKNIFSKTYERIIHPLLFKVLSPTIFFEYGFIGRDIAVLNRHIDYHIVNMVDIARVLCLLRRTSMFMNYLQLYNSYINILENGLGIIKHVPNYEKYIYEGELNIAWLCELSLLLKDLNITSPFKTYSFLYPNYNPFIY